MRILVQATVANFRESELPCDDAKLVLYLRPDSGLMPVSGALLIGQCSGAGNRIPGIGEATIAVIWAEFGDATQFKNAKVLAAFVGVAPRIRQSGSSIRGRGMMSGTGRSKLRKAFFMPAVVGLRYNPVIKKKCSTDSSGQAKNAYCWGCYA